MWNCKHCNQQYDNFTTSQKANHSRWCESNPKRDSYKEKSSKIAILAMREAKSKSGATNQYTKAKVSNLPVPECKLKGRKLGKGKPHTEETKKLLSEKARASDHRRLKKTCYQVSN